MSQVGPDGLPLGWVIAYQYSSAEVARQAYEAVRNAILLDEDAGASVFRFLLDDDICVALLADSPLPAKEQQLVESLLAPEGTRVTLSVAILEELYERRREIKSSGPGYTERRTQD